MSPRSGVARVATARAGLTSVAILADGTVVAGSDAGTIEAWSLLPGNLQPRTFHLAGGGSHAHDAAVTALATCGGGPGGEILVSAGGDGAIVAWERLDETNTNLKNGEWRPACKARHAHLGPVHGLAASADGSMLASVGEDGYVRVWSAPVGARGSLGDNDASSQKHSMTPLALAFTNEPSSHGGVPDTTSIWNARSATLGPEMLKWRKLDPLGQLQQATGSLLGSNNDSEDVYDGASRVGASASRSGS